MNKVQEIIRSKTYIKLLKTPIGEQSLELDAHKQILTNQILIIEMLNKLEIKLK